MLLADWDACMSGLQKVYTATLTEKERLEADLYSCCSKASKFEQDLGECRGVVQQLQQANARLSADMEVVTATNKRLASQMEGHQQQLQQEIQKTKRYKLNAKDAEYENDEIKKQLVGRGLRGVLVEMGIADDE
jgi:chromosome segregation ATPase